MASDQVGVGLVGAGFIGQVHAEAFSRSALASVRAVASASPDRAAAFAARWGIPASGADYRELVARPDVDLVCVAAPNWLHRDIAELRQPPASTSCARNRWPARCKRPMR